MNKHVKAPLIAGGIALVIAVLPLLATLVAALIANAKGCVLHEGFSNPCVLMGVDVGNVLYAMGTSFWLLLLSVPVGAVGMLVSVVWLAVGVLRTRRGT